MGETGRAHIATLEEEVANGGPRDRKRVLFEQSEKIRNILATSL